MRGRAAADPGAPADRGPGARTARDSFPCSARLAPNATRSSAWLRYSRSSSAPRSRCSPADSSRRSRAERMPPHARRSAPTSGSPRRTSPRTSSTRRGARRRRGVAPVYADVRTLVHFPRTDANVTVFVVDAEELRAVQGEGGMRSRRMRFARGAMSGAVPVVVSDAVVELADGVAVRGPGRPGRHCRDRGRPVSVRTLGNLDRGRPRVRGQMVFPTFSPTMVLVDVADGASVADVRASLTGLLGAGSATTIPEEVAASHHADPGSGALAAGLFSAIGAVAVLLAIAIALTARAVLRGSRAPLRPARSARPAASAGARTRGVGVGPR